MAGLAFEPLPAYAPRSFVPADANLGDWTQIEPLLSALERRCPAITTVRELEQWLLDWGELSAALDQESAVRYIAMTCQTDDAAAEKAYLDFIEHIEPKLKPPQFRLAQLYLKQPLRHQLPMKRYEVFDRDTQVHVELFREENVPLETEEAKLGQQYQKLMGGLTVRFRGEDKTLVQMARYLEETDRTTRQEAWQLTAEKRLSVVDECEAIFDELLRLRHQIARNAGFANYLEYAWRSKRRFDYTPADCRRFHDSIESLVMPVGREIFEDRRREMGLETLRPWDLAVDPKGRPPLRPFNDVGALIAGTEQVFDRLDTELADQFRQMRDLRLLDLANRKGKAPGGYQSTLNEARLPFIFMNAVGVHRDVDTLLHESGHAFHALATRPEPMYAYRSAPIEFCEVASMSMELLCRDQLERFYSGDDARRARRDQLEGIVKFFPWMASVDAFQHWIYTHPGHSRDERRQAWEEITRRFGDPVDWSGLERVRSYLWHRQLHIFLYPFYYVEYGIAQLGALHIWRNAAADRGEALRAYKAGLRLGGSRPLPELFAAAGCRFAFDQETILPLVEGIRGALRE